MRLRCAPRSQIPGGMVDGQLVQVTVESGKTEERVVVPQVALIADQQGIYVFAVEDGKAVVRREVGQTGAARPSCWKG